MPSMRTCILKSHYKSQCCSKNTATQPSPIVLAAFLMLNSGINGVKLYSRAMPTLSRVNGSFLSILTSKVVHLNIESCTLILQSPGSCRAVSAPLEWSHLGYLCWSWWLNKLPTYIQIGAEEATATKGLKIQQVQLMLRTPRHNQAIKPYIAQPASFSGGACI